MHRRGFLHQLFGAAMLGGITQLVPSFTGSAQGQSSIIGGRLPEEKSPLRITDLKTFIVNRGASNYVYLKIYTNEGITGLSEASLEGRAKSVIAELEIIKRYLIGKDPTLIEHHWQALYRHPFWRGGVVMLTALSAVDIALWDIWGKYLNQPIYRLLGGPCRDKIRTYGHFGGREPEDYARSAERMVSLGFNAIKTGGGFPMEMVEGPDEIRKYVRRLEKTREVIGDEVDILVDGHGKLTPTVAIQVGKAMEHLNLLFIEEPVLPENVDAMKKVSGKVDIPIATGERLFTKWAFREYFEKEKDE